MRKQSNSYGVWNNLTCRCPAGNCEVQVLRRVQSVPREQSWHSDVGRADDGLLSTANLEPHLAMDIGNTTTQHAPITHLCNMRPIHSESPRNHTPKSVDS